MGIIEDNDINTNKYSYLALTFYVTFLFFELPQGFMLQHFPTAKYLGINGKLISEEELQKLTIISHTLGHLCYP